MYKTSKKELVEKYEYDTIKLRNSFYASYYSKGGRKELKISFETYIMKILKYGWV